jgi:carbonic anhydrase
MPQAALQQLREGNFRFISNLKKNRNLLNQVNQTKDGQWPFAAIVSCMDSRTSAELIFDQGLGDIFSIRLAGNVISENVLGSLEYACKVAGSKLIVVLGHTKCGAIRGACDHIQLGNLTTLLSKIQPALFYEKTVTLDRTSNNLEFVNKVTEIHVKRSVESVIQQSYIIRELILKGELGLIGGLYDVETGEVEFYEDTFMVGEIKDINYDHPSNAL